ncbi:MAG: hypothetical protein LBC68_11260 [Prevotellaceae bacterium]|nr:hypothetical protein [Prevotellaceae bacterium]
MKNSVLIFVVISLLAGACGSKKTVLTGDTRFVENINAQAKATTQTDSTAQIQLSQAEQKNIDSEDYEQKIRIEFDTEKPINSNTKLPPVQSVEIIKKGQKTSDKSAKTTEQSNIINYDKATIDELNNRIQIDSAEKITEETTKKESQFIKWIAVIAVSIAVIFVAVVIRKALKGAGIFTYIKNLFK